MNAIVEHTENCPAPLAQVPIQHAVVSMIERAARDPSVDLDKLERLIAMQREAVKEAAAQEFAEAMAAAQGEMRAIAADSNNPQTRSKYASYFALDKALRPIYTKHGLALSFDTGDGAPEGHVRVLCYLSKKGFTRTYHVDMPADGKGAKGGDVMTKTHAVGAGLTYGQRYLLKLIFNIAVGDDDDGNSASTPQQTISPEQVEELQSLIVEVGADIPRFYAHFKIAGLPDLPLKRFAEAKRALEAKRGRE